MKTRKLVYGGALIALGILIPQAFHGFGENAGMVFLPMHLPIFIGGFLLGPVYGGVMGVVVPALSFVLTGMPAAPKLYFMFFELLGYGVLSGIFIRKCNIYLALIGAMLGGRILYAGTLIVGANLLNIHAPFMSMSAFTAGIVTGIPGIFIQIVLVPALILGLKKGGYTFD